MTELIGWLATSITICSFFSKSEKTLKIIQMGGSLAWILYGVLMDSNPVITANILVVGAILASLLIKKAK